MQPFDYRLAVQNPVAMALQGYMQGQQFQNQRVQAERDTQLYDMQMQQYQMQQQNLQQEQARAQQMQADLGEFADAMENGTATRDMLTRLEFKYGDIIGEHVSAAYEGKSQEYKDAQASKIARIGIAFTRSPEEGMRFLQIEKEAAQNAGDQQLLDSIEMMEGEAKISSAAPTASSLFVLGKLLPPEQFEAYKAIVLPPPVEREVVTTDEGVFAVDLSAPDVMSGMQRLGAAPERSPLVQVGGEQNAFERKSAELQATNIAELVQSGQTARRNNITLNELESLINNVETGGMAAVKGFAGNLGIPVEGLDDIQAFTAIINRLVPEQRPPGSGTMSDADLALFKQSLPRLINQPGGNKKILRTMRALNNYLIQEAEIAEMILDGPENGGITRAEGRRRLAELGNPLAEFSAGAGTPQARRRFDAQGKEIK